MPQPAARFAALALTLLLAGAAHADMYGRSQHGGRATGQAGAFVARADDPAAVRYNPAALVRLEGVGLLAGLDFDAPTDDASGPEGSARAEHSIQFPPVVYLGWHPEGARWAVGVGVDSPLWRLIDWDTALFPGRFEARSSDARLLELRAVGAWAIDERWSLGLALRALDGDLGYGDAVIAEESSSSGPVSFEVDRLAEASGDGFGFDLALHYAAPGWGFGAVWSSAAEVEGNGDLTYRPRDLAGLPEDAQAAARARFRPGSTRIREVLPDRITVGAWWAPVERLQVEVDLETALWGSAAAPEARHEPEVVGPGFQIERRASWQDAWAVRVGAELGLDRGWSFYGGLGFESSPIRDFEPGAPRGDTAIVALGGGYQLEKITFDVGWSYHGFSDVKVQEAGPPAPRTTYSAHAQVWSVSARWSL